MQSLVKVGEAMQQLFGKLAESAAQESGVIQRTRKFTPLSLGVCPRTQTEILRSEWGEDFFVRAVGVDFVNEVGNHKLFESWGFCGKTAVCR